MTFLPYKKLRLIFGIGLGAVILSVSGSFPAKAAPDFLPVQIPGWITADNTADEPTATPQPSRPKKKIQKTDETPRLLKPEDYKAALEQVSIKNEDGSIPSSIESLYSSRIKNNIQQFGYELFDSQPAIQKPISENVAPPAGAVQDNFVLGIGDKLSITFRGQRNIQNTYSINNSGQLIVEDLSPISAAGKTIAQVRETLSANASGLYNTDVFVSLESVKQINILVVGHVREPGRKTLTVFNTALDALIQSGGVEKTGSLRQIKLIRDGHIRQIDLYAVLSGTNSKDLDLSIRDGDRIVIPTIGPTLAISGDVKRPAIYELTGPDISAKDALSMAGGLLSPGNNRATKLTLSKDGREIAEQISLSRAPRLGDGSILMIDRASEKRSESVELLGNTREPGLHALSQASSLSALLKDPQILGPDIYPLIGVIIRDNTNTMTQQILDFPPSLVVHGRYDRKLQDGDKIILFSRTEILALQKDKPAPDNKPAIDDTNTSDNKSDLSKNPVLQSFLKERSVFIRGSVRDAGAWPVSDGATLESALAVAGGLSFEANTSNIEITTNLSGEGHQSNGRSGTQRLSIDFANTNPNTILIGAGDAIRVNQKFLKTQGQSISIAGEVFHPGRYDLLPGDTLGKLLERAGGLTEQAYPEGTIFSRDADRKAEEARFRAAARELERAVAAAAEKKDTAPDTEKMAMVRDLATELKEVQGVGRITVQSNPAVLKAHPEQDILLEPNDRIYIPRRPMTVRVYGEVLSPANLQFRKDKMPNNYLDEAGGLTYYADEDRVFVLFPDGSAQPLQVSAWNHRAAMIPPGSTIIVPRDPKPFDFIESAKDITQILSNLAITSVFVNDIKNN